MIKIIKISLPQNILRKFLCAENQNLFDSMGISGVDLDLPKTEDERQLFGLIRNMSVDYSTIDREVVESSVMSNISDKWVECSRLMELLFWPYRIHGSTDQYIEDLTAEYKLLRTRAPTAYDYDYVINLGKVHGEFGEERLVAIPTQNVRYQSGRYSSGLYTPIMCE